jgi:hypothetical protein
MRIFHLIVMFVKICYEHLITCNITFAPELQDDVWRPGGGGTCVNLVSSQPVRSHWGHVREERRSRPRYTEGAPAALPAAALSNGAMAAIHQREKSGISEWCSGTCWPLISAFRASQSKPARLGNVRRRFSLQHRSPGRNWFAVSMP